MLDAKNLPVGLTVLASKLQTYFDKIVDVLRTKKDSDDKISDLISMSQCLTDVQALEVTMTSGSDPMMSSTVRTEENGSCQVGVAALAGAGSSTLSQDAPLGGADAGAGTDVRPPLDPVIMDEVLADDPPIAQLAASVVDEYFAEK